MRLPYRIVRPLARIALKIYFKKIYLTGLENLPEDKPIILAANHPTAFLEPCLLACLLPMPLHFMVRGDFFQKPIFRKMLESLHMIPMYRMKDIGIKGVRNNFSSLDIVYDYLKKNTTILILAEGTTVHEKRLRPIRKGAARMAIGAIEKYPDLGVQIIPLGVNYTDVIRFRSTVMLDIGTPMEVKEYLKNTQQHRAKTINLITKDLKEQLIKNVIHIAETADDDMVNQALEVRRNETNQIKFPIQVADRQPLKQEIKVANYINQLALGKKDALKKHLVNYFTELQTHHVVDLTVKTNRVNSFWDYLLYIVGYFPYILGYLLNFLPLFFGKWWSENKVSEIEFVAPIKASFSLAAYLVYMISLLLIGVFIRHKLFWVMLLAIPLLGIYALYFRDFKIKFLQQHRWASIENAQREAIQRQRANILSQL